MTEPVQPTRKPRQRPNGFSLIVASNVGIFVALILVLSGIFASSDGVIIAGIAVFVLAIALSFLHARRRRRRMKQ